ncbi:MAG: ABC transporter permease [Candidatus Caenarcaniphilales bacterium]|nr:ABC transporter permease [Candidatus Caenarcaniphilales bacterium]
MNDFIYISKRFLNSIILILIISFITFLLMKADFTIPKAHLDLGFFKYHINEVHIQTGDPLADLKLNPNISETQIAAERERLGLDKPFFSQYFTWLRNLIHGDLGFTQANQKVIDVIKPALKNTLILNFCAIFFSWFIAIPLGIFAAVKQDKWQDYSIRFFVSSLMAIPSFVIAIFMLLFALYSGVFPIGGLTGVMFDEMNFFEKLLDISRHLFIPVSILTLAGLPGIQRQMRANLIEVLDKPYVTTAKAKGLDGKIVVFKHAVRNAINPLVTLFGFEFASLFAGSALIEMVISYPGLGLLTLEAARKQDVNLVMANLLLGSFMLVVGNLVADLLLKKLDPRV